MEKILVVASSRTASDSLTELLKEAGYTDISESHSAEDAKKKVSAENFDTVIVNTPVADQTAPDICIWLSRNTPCGIVMIVKDGTSDEIKDKMASMGVFVLQKPFARQNFIMCIKMVGISNSRVKNITEQNQTLVKKIEDISLVGRAKKVLTGRLGMSEDQAHHYIERQAMDQRKNKREIAELIIRTYEN